jgi:hypothetical protein
MKQINECTNLLVNAGVVLNDLLISAITSLDDEFIKADLHAQVTSGIRTGQKQLSLIVEKCKKHGVDKEFPLILGATLDNVDSWLYPWGRLLTLGEMINPPLPAHAPFDYLKPNGDIRKAGNFIDISNHMKAHSFDISGANLSTIENVIKDSLTRCEMIKGYLKEPVNNAVHVDCQDVKLNNF